MEMNYLTDGVSSYFVADNICADIDSYEINMMSNNDIEGLLPFEFRSLNEDRMLYFKINGYTKLSELVTDGYICIDYIEKLYSGLVCIIKDIGGFMLHPDSLVIDFRNIFYCNATKCFCFAYIPGYRVDIRKQLVKLTEDFIRYINHRDHRAVDIAYGIYDIVAKPCFDLDEITKHIDRVNGISNHSNCDKNTKNGEYSNYVQRDKANDNISQRKEREMLMDSLFLEDEEVVHISENTGRNKTISESIKNNYRKICMISIIVTAVAGLLMFVFQPDKSNQSGYIKIMMVVLMLMAIECFIYIQLSKYDNRNEENTEAIGYDDFSVTKPVLECIPGGGMYVDTTDTKLLVNETDTTLLSDEMDTTSLLGALSDNISYRLVACEGNNVIDINEASVIVGRDRSTANAVIDNKAVSRLHAKICIDNNKLQVYDMKSTNGTFVNDKSVEAGRFLIAGDGDIISFGNVDYYVESIELPNRKCN